VPKWLNKFSSVKRLLWDLNIMKYRVIVRHQVAMKYSREKPRQRRKKFLILRPHYGMNHQQLGIRRSFKMLKMEYDSIYEQITKV